MKFEKLSDNKIRIILTIQDLAEKNIDFQAFMSNNIESQDILLDMLEEAKKETGFDAENSNLKIEALALADTNFVFTITKITPEADKNKVLKRKIMIKRKCMNPSTTQAIYIFHSFEDFCSLLKFLSQRNLMMYSNAIADNIELYSYKNNYYLLMNDIHSVVIDKIKFYTCITEFARCITNSKVFASKLKECGTLVMKNNALEIGFENFVKKTS